MIKERINYFILVIITVILGLLSRQVDFIPLWVGDSLWAIMIYLLMKMIWIRESCRKIGAISLLICYVIEFSQLYQAPWIVAVRSTLPGRLVLGQGFLWCDILAYTVGVSVIYLADNYLAED